jgi:hypothetical protein
MTIKKVYRVWGIAHGIRTTKEAAPGALCTREYPPEKVDEGKKDFRVIITVEKDVIPLQKEGTC